MKKIMVSLLVAFLMVFFLGAAPASARHNRFGRDIKPRARSGRPRSRKIPPQPPFFQGGS
jgi:hypothetical protein